MARVRASRWRWVRRGVVALCVGVVVNVMVAWGIALWWCPYGDAKYPKNETVFQWGVAVPADWPAPSSQFSESSMAKARVITTGYLKESEQFQIEEVQSGFPMRSMSRVFPMCPPGYRKSFSLWCTGIEIDSRFATSSDWTSWGLPLLPLWLGFVVNTMCYSVGVILLMAARGVVRRWRRIPRGRCGACGYDVKGIAGGVCPECGGSTLSGSL